MSTPLLSICIPTYNRIYKLKKQIEHLISLEDVRFNLIISDNNSDDGTGDYFKMLKDERILFVHHDKAVPAAVNGYDCLLRATGKYALFMLDKDFLESNNLPCFLDELEQSSVGCGYCVINSKKTIKETICFQPGMDSFEKIAYGCKHPSGFFFKTSLIHEVIGQTKMLAEEGFPFTLDVVMAHITYRESLMIFDMKLVSKETNEEMALAKTLTYSKRNLWFFKEPLEHQMEVYIKDMLTLGFSKSRQDYIAQKIFFRQSSIGTLSYTRFMADEQACSHYNIEPRKISISENCSNMFAFRRYFLKIYPTLCFFNRIKFEIKFVYKFLMCSMYLFYVEKK